MEDHLSIAWRALCRQLEDRGAQLLHEVSSYPTPIARCDLQLTHLLEQRDQAFARLRQAQDLDHYRSSLSHAAWKIRLREFVNRLQPPGDASLTAACARLVDALER
jgi:hypothetical protein